MLQVKGCEKLMSFHLNIHCANPDWNQKPAVVAGLQPSNHTFGNDECSGSTIFSRNVWWEITDDRSVDGIVPQRMAIPDPMLQGTSIFSKHYDASH